MIKNKENDGSLTMSKVLWTIGAVTLLLLVGGTILAVARPSMDTFYVAPEKAASLVAVTMPALASMLILLNVREFILRSRQKTALENAGIDSDIVVTKIRNSKRISQRMADWLLIVVLSFAVGIPTMLLAANINTTMLQKKSECLAFAEKNGFGSTGILHANLNSQCLITKSLTAFPLQSAACIIATLFLFLLLKRSPRVISLWYKVASRLGKLLYVLIVLYLIVFAVAFAFM